MIGKVLARAAARWTGSIFRLYAVTLLNVAPRKVALSLALMLFVSVTQGVQLLLLIPLMQLVGLDVQQGSVGWLAGFVSDAFAAIGVRPDLITVLLAFVLFTVSMAAVRRWQTIYNFKLQESFSAILRRRLYSAVANSDWLTFSRRRSSDFVHTLTIEVERVGAATVILLGMIADIALGTVYVLLALKLSAAMTALVFVSGAGLLLLLRGKTREAQWTGEDISLATNGLYSAAIEHFGAMKTTKSYGAEERNADIFSGLVEQVAHMRLRSVRNQAETGFWFGVGSVMSLCALLYAAFEMMGMSAAGLLLLLFLFNRIVPLFGGIQRDYQQFLNVMPAFAATMEMVDHFEAAHEPVAGLRQRVELRDGIDFEAVSFSYDGKESDPAIRDLDLTIRAGETTAIVGPSGAGKSTIADLVMGLIVPGRGRVLVDGLPLEAERIRAWRGEIGYVAQDTFLFNDTVKANLLWACPEASDEEIRQALRMAVAEDFVRGLPDGMETMLGDRGVRLSGGEKQRLALARALLRRPSLLILDEATSALDSENERRIQAAIEKLHGRVTILLITHRLSTIRNADVIHVLERGVLAESGGWKTLTGTAGGRFKALCAAQGVRESGETSAAEGPELEKPMTPEPRAVAASP